MYHVPALSAAGMKVPAIACEYLVYGPVSRRAYYCAPVAGIRDIAGPLWPIRKARPHFVTEEEVDEVWRIANLFGSDRKDGVSVQISVMAAELARRQFPGEKRLSPRSTKEMGDHERETRNRLVRSDPIYNPEHAPLESEIITDIVDQLILKYMSLRSPSRGDYRKLGNGEIYTTGFPQLQLMVKILQELDDKITEMTRQPQHHRDVSKQPTARIHEAAGSKRRRTSVDSEMGNDTETQPASKRVRMSE